jgi:hypothetical protein
MKRILVLGMYGGPFLQALADEAIFPNVPTTFAALTGRFDLKKRFVHILTIHRVADVGVFSHTSHCDLSLDRTAATTLV